MTDVILPELLYLRTNTLKHSGDCCLLAATSELHIYAEEIYGEDGWIAHHHIDSDGKIVETIDEDEGKTTVSAPITIPEDALRPASGWQTMWLNFAGARHRGMRALERIDELVRPFSVQDKMRLNQHPSLNDIPPFRVIGLTESYVLSEARTMLAGLYFVCRRLRLAYLLEKPGIDEIGEPFDYDSRVLYIAHFAARNAALDDDLVEQMQPLPGCTVHRPMDCVIAGQHLIIADGGDGERLSAIHVWKVNHRGEVLTAEEKLRRRIYG